MKALGLVLIMFCLATTVSAHVLSTSGNVAAVMHIAPNDDPRVGETSIISFLFQNNIQCGCTVAINDETIPSLRLTPRNISFDYIFPKLGLYTVVVTGADFSLTYKIDVDDQVNPNTAMVMSPGLHTLHITLLSLPILIGLGIILSSYWEKRKSGNFPTEPTS